MTAAAAVSLPISLSCLNLADLDALKPHVEHRDGRVDVLFANAGGIRVNAVAPGHIATNILRKAGFPDDMVDGINAQITTQVPVGRLGTGEDIAKAALFLALDDASYVTGIELAVDSGWTQV